MRTLKYNPQKIESKWRKHWEQKKLYQTNIKDAKRPYYNLMMFPYPSAEGLHVGNVYAFTGSDIYGRFRRMRGDDVFEPMGFDAFGIHSENFAIKKGIHPKTLVARSVANFRKQLNSLGCLFDWEHEVNTTDPNYYKWTQWLFLQLFKAGLAYRAKAPVDWCPSCKTVLADEQVIQGRCERCDSEVVQKELEQWFFRITKYADRLLKNLDVIDWSERTKITQRNWIGRSEGTEIEFEIVTSLNNAEPYAEQRRTIKVYTTRPDTLFGATYVVLAPEHQALLNLKPEILNLEEVEDYIKKAQRKTELERAELAREKTGIELKGIKAVNPANGEELPVFVADYISASYGTGAIMAVPMHDERDFEFAKKYRLPMRTVIVPAEKRTCLLIHGFGGSSKKDWFVWLKGILEKEGWDVIIPDLPNTDHPVFEEWMKALEAYADRLNDRSIVLGHSLGGYAALQFIQRLSKKISKVILVASVEEKWRKDHIDIRKNLEPELDWDSVIAFTNKETDYHKVESLADKVVFFFSDDDPYVPLDVKVIYQEKIQGYFHVLSGKKHFNGKDFPEIIEEFQEPYSEDGVLINSDEFSGMESERARWEIAKFVKGEKVTKYHLRDWLISRQRYWGPPIPTIYCRKCWEIRNSKSEIRNKSKTPNSKFKTKQQREGIDYVVIDGKEYAIVPVPEKDLPVPLPYVKEFRPTGTGKSPLASVEKFVNTKCPICKGLAKRETDVSDNFLDSSWYYLRYPSVGMKNEKLKMKNHPEAEQARYGAGNEKLKTLELPWNADVTKKWLPVDMYMGGQEHAVLHLLYTRFITMALKDMGYLSFDEPFKKFRAHGLLTKGGAKMSKSRGNVVNPDDYYKRYGADTLRMYLMFLGPFEQGGDWSDAGIVGITRFLNRIWDFVQRWNMEHQNFRFQISDFRFQNREIEILRHKTIKKVTEDIENLRYNTAIAALMEYLNKISDFRFQISEYEVKTLLLLLAPFAPYISEELWNQLRGPTQTKRRLTQKGQRESSFSPREFASIHNEKWPKWDEKYLKEEKVTIIIQINGRVRDQVGVEKSTSEEKVKEAALAREKIKQWVAGKEIKKVIFVPNRIINFVI